MVTYSCKGDFKKTYGFFEKIKEAVHIGELDKYGREGVQALSAATPIDSGETAASWTYQIVRNGDSVAIEWHNTNVVDGVNIAVILQYGHGTRNGGFVRGRDYINPAMRPVFDDIANKAWKEVTK